MSRLFVLTVLLTVVAAGCGTEDPPRSSSGDAQLVDGGLDAFEAKLATLRGRPVVVNQWASWCGPCRYEFPFLARQAKTLKGRVEFIGVNAQDNREDAEKFLAKNPTGFPHFYDDDLSIARSFRGGRAWPTTAYYDAAGKLNYTHQGSYPDEARLAEDIQRYALGG